MFNKNYEKIDPLKPVNKNQINHLILNYLVVEGYESAALKFSKEIGVTLETDGDESDENIDTEFRPRQVINGIQSIRQRNEIKLLLLKGEVSSVIDKLNEYYPLLLEYNDFLYFKILLLNLVEIIKKYHIENKKSSTTNGSGLNSADTSGVTGSGVGTSASGSKRRNSDFVKKKRRVSSASSGSKTRRKSSVTRMNTEMKKEQEFFNLIISFVKDKLFSKAIKNKVFLQELELSMCLLLLDYNDLTNPSNLNNIPKDLINLMNNKNFKNEVFNLVNNAILKYNSAHLITSNSSEKLAEFETGNTKIDSDFGKFNHLLNQDFMNNNESAQYKNNYVFYDSDSDNGEEDTGIRQTQPQSPDLADANRSKYQNLNKLLLDDSVEDVNTDDENQSADLNTTFLTNNVNSRFKQLINLWMWGENTLSDLPTLPKVDLNELMSDGT